MKFDEKYPDAGEEWDAPEGVFRHPDESYSCIVCNEQCYWTSYNWLGAVCSTECNDHLFDDYGEACRYEWIHEHALYYHSKTCEGRCNYQCNTFVCTHCRKPVSEDFAMEPCDDCKAAVDASEPACFLCSEPQPPEEPPSKGPCVCGEDDPNPFCARCMGCYDE